MKLVRSPMIKRTVSPKGLTGGSSGDLLVCALSNVPLTELGQLHALVRRPSACQV